MDPEAFRRLAHEAVDRLADHLTALPDGPVFTPMKPPERERLVNTPLAREGREADAVLTDIETLVFPRPMGNGHPRFFGWVNSPPAPIGIVAELLAAGLNPSCAGGDHAAVYLERAAVRWLMELVGFPTEGSMGLLVSGGSVASLTCLAAARQWATAREGWGVRHEGLQTSRPALVLYTSTEGHSCIRKAVEVLGLGARNLRLIAVDADFRMDLTALADQVAQDRAAGLRPFCVVASAGTVSTGATDPLDDLADFCAVEALWLHVDGAYGAVGRLDASVSDAYRGLERAQSLALDPHKWLSVPVECGCALVRDGQLLRDTFSLVPAYLRTEEGRGFGGLPWYSEYGIQQSRGFRALKLWMTLQHLGQTGVAGLVTRHNALARYLARKIDAAPDLERLAPVCLSIVCFRYVPPRSRLDEDGLATLNKRLMETIQAEGRAFLSNITPPPRPMSMPSSTSCERPESDWHPCRRST
jgi:glutamate/tyrosine decarboxylase-like PLP-dependent enzyme